MSRPRGMNVGRFDLDPEGRFEGYTGRVCGEHRTVGHATEEDDR